MRNHYTAAHSTAGLRFHIETYGCQMNFHDSEKIAGILYELGHSAAEDKLDANLIIFNTCCVRENAENKLFGNVGALKQHKRRHPDTLIAVCGCMMQQEGVAEELLARYPFVDIIFGTTNMDELPNLLLHAREEKGYALRIRETPYDEDSISMVRNPPPLASVNIMQGCNNFCTFCIVPYVRGRERSRSVDSIVREVEGLLEDGYKEVMLLGQNVNSYGSGGDVDFPMLLDRVANTGIERIRFMTSHPKDASKRMIEQMAKHDNIASQLHLPVQAGSSDVLDRMNRRYTREAYLALIDEVRSMIPDVTLTTDIMVGFPGETEEDFLKTLSLVEQVRFDSAFTFVYSIRSGTKAASFEDQVGEDVKQDRIVRLVAAQSKITFEKNKAQVGNRARVLVEGVSTRGAGYICGRTDGGKMVNMEGSEAYIGSFVDVEIIEGKKTTLLGRILA